MEDFVKAGQVDNSGSSRLAAEVYQPQRMAQVEPTPGPIPPRGDTEPTPGPIPPGDNNNRNDNTNNNNNRNDNTNNNNNRNDNTNNNNNRNDNTNNNNNRNDNTNNNNNRNDNHNTANGGQGGDARSNIRINNPTTTVIANAPSLAGGECTTGKSLGISVGMFGIGAGASGGWMHPDQQCLDMKQLSQIQAQACAQSTNDAATAQNYDRLLLQTGQELGSNPVAPLVAGRAEQGAVRHADNSMVNGQVCREVSVEIARKNGITLPQVELVGTDFHAMAAQQAHLKRMQAAEQRQRQADVGQTIQQVVIVETGKAPAAQAARKRRPAAKPKDDCPDKKK